MFQSRRWMTIWERLRGVHKPRRLWPMGPRLTLSSTLFLGLCAVAHGEPSSPAVWGAITQPATGSAEAIGGYSAGCLVGAARLPLQGEGYRVTRPERGRIWGHPLLVRFIKQLGALARSHKLPLVFVGDLGQPRGGPAPSGHASHQTGLDVDVAYSAPQNGKPPSMLDEKKPQRPGRLFSGKVVRLLKLAVMDARVDRMFVNPVLKRALCEAGGDRSWLHKLRPWWGHHDHFHVRLACPDGNADCVKQAPLPPGDGCGELGWWFSAEAQADRGKAHDAYSAKVGAGPDLPARCSTVRDTN